MRRHQLLAARAFVLLASLLGFVVQPRTSTEAGPSLQRFAAPRPADAPSGPQPAGPQPAAPRPATPTALRPQCRRFVQAAASVAWRTRLRELEAIAWRESRCQPRATNTNRNGTKDWGVVQINDVNIAHLRALGVIDHPRDLFDLTTSARAALALYRRDGGFCSWQAPHYC